MSYKDFNTKVVKDYDEDVHKLAWKLSQERLKAKEELNWQICKILVMFLSVLLVTLLV